MARTAPPTVGKVRQWAARGRSVEDIAKRFGLTAADVEAIVEEPMTEPDDGRHLTPEQQRHAAIAAAWPRRGTR